MSVPQRQTKVMKGFELLLKNEEFKLIDVDESKALDTPWTIEFSVPENSPYHPRLVKISVSFSGRYPFEPPAMKFITPIYHPNIDTNGTICLDLLKPLPAGAWKPSIDIITLLMAVKLLLADPNPEDPLMPEIAAEFRERPEEYKRRANVYTGQSFDENVVKDDNDNNSLSEELPKKRSLFKKFEKEKIAQTVNVDQTIEIDLASTHSPESLDCIDLCHEDDEFEEPKLRRGLHSSKLKP